MAQTIVDRTNQLGKGSLRPSASLIRTAEDAAVDALEMLEDAAGKPPVPDSAAKICGICTVVPTGSASPDMPNTPAHLDRCLTQASAASVLGFESLSSGSHSSVASSAIQHKADGQESYGAWEHNPAEMDVQLVVEELRKLVSRVHQLEVENNKLELANLELSVVNGCLKSEVTHLIKEQVVNINDLMQQGAMTVGVEAHAGQGSNQTSLSMEAARSATAVNQTADDPSDGDIPSMSSTSSQLDVFQHEQSSDILQPITPTRSDPMEDLRARFAALKPGSISTDSTSLSCAPSIESLKARFVALHAHSLNAHSSPSSASKSNSSSANVLMSDANEHTVSVMAIDDKPSRDANQSACSSRQLQTPVKASCSIASITGEPTAYGFTGNTMEAKMSSLFSQFAATVCTPSKEYEASCKARFVNADSDTEDSEDSEDSNSDQQSSYSKPLFHAEETPVKGSGQQADAKLAELQEKVQDQADFMAALEEEMTDMQARNNAEMAAVKSKLGKAEAVGDAYRESLMLQDRLQAVEQAEAAPASEPWLGLQLDKGSIMNQKIGGGGYGNVYATKPGRCVKVVKVAAEQLGKALREAVIGRVAQQRGWKHVNPILRFSIMRAPVVWADQDYWVLTEMERATKSALDMFFDLACEPKPATANLVTLVQKMATHTCLGLRELESAGLLDSDLKLENLLVFEQKVGNKVEIVFKVADLDLLEARTGAHIYAGMAKSANYMSGNISRDMMGPGDHIHLLGMMVLVALTATMHKEGQHMTLDELLLHGNWSKKILPAYKCGQMEEAVQPLAPEARPLAKFALSRMLEGCVQLASLEDVLQFMASESDSSL